jgi:hypothetical protein
MAFVSWQSVLHGIEATQGGISDTFSLIFQGQVKNCTILIEIEIIMSEIA